MILLSNGGTNIQRAKAASGTIVVGTVDDIAVLQKTERGAKAPRAARRVRFECDVPPVSKADFYKGLVRDRVKLANVDDIVASPTAAQRWQEAAKAL